MSEQVLKDFLKEEIVYSRTRKLLDCENEIQCNELIKDLSIGQLMKLSAYLN
ncbi:hypothetical protein LS684_18950 [Cytobacillus spongiae]|uniref:hypothetical protein n=1 Tax=Cytobacillus spongiae TaxID=2901381 RepID=UPI001F2F7BCD|nr:hypothetical protein [Cytobacillus spongiae]UII55679.1 hypothetical protein LS684_18950 [Cytobacillus spongiae]